MFNHVCTECRKTFATQEDNPVKVQGQRAAQWFYLYEVENCFCSFVCAKNFVDNTKKVGTDLTKKNHQD